LRQLVPERVRWLTEADLRVGEMRTRLGCGGTQVASRY
jgi:hypothetical protein